MTGKSSATEVKEPLEKQTQDILGPPADEQSRLLEESILALDHALDALKVSDKEADEPLQEHVSTQYGPVNRTMADSETSELEVLLSLCNQVESENFSTYIANLHNIADIRKLGEASYSEVFLSKIRPSANEFEYAHTVLKIIPFGTSSAEIPIADIVQEIRISRLLSPLESYITLKGCRIVSGKYPEKLLDEWDDWSDEHGSESTRPDWYESTQLYAVVELEHGGVDLEHFAISTWKEAEQIFTKLVKALAQGEQAFEFEHRDLHWGNILISCPPGKLESHARHVTIIDYTLSRARCEDDIGSIAFNSFSDPALFEADAEVDYQFEIYRYMRDLTSPLSMSDHRDTKSSPELSPERTDWSGFSPLTNVLWLHYVVDKLLYWKELKTPPARKSSRKKIDGKKQQSQRLLETEGERQAWELLNQIWNELNPEKPGKENIMSSTQLYEWMNSLGKDEPCARAVLL